MRDLKFVRDKAVSLLRSKPVIAALFALGGLLAALGISYFDLEGRRAFYLYAFTAAAFMLSIALAGRRVRAILLMLGIIAASSYLDAALHTKHPARDALILLACMALAIFGTVGGSSSLPWYGRVTRLPPRVTLGMGLSGVFLAWVAISAFEQIDRGGSGRSASEESCMALLNAPSLARGDQASGRSHPPIALALSGGGYRAAVFHAGVIAELRDAGLMPKALTTVSGGSIIGAWVATGRSPEEFTCRVRGGAFNTVRALANAINVARLALAVRLPTENTSVLPVRPFTRTDVQAAVLDRALFHGMRFSELRSRNDAPALMIATTCLCGAFGPIVGITAFGALGVNTVQSIAQVGLDNPPRYRLQERPYFEPDSDVAPAFEEKVVLPGSHTLAEIVAASGAFPGAFAAEWLQLFPAGPDGADKYPFVDGGVTDNLGVALMRSAQEEAQRQEQFRSLLGSTAIAQIRDSILNEYDDMSEQVKRNLDSATIVDSYLRTDLRPWHVGLMLVSDGSAFPNTLRRVTPMSELPTALDLIYSSSANSSIGRNSVSTPVFRISPYPGLDDPANTLDSTEIEFFISGMASGDAAKAKAAASDAGWRLYSDTTRIKSELRRTHAVSKETRAQLFLMTILSNEINYKIDTFKSTSTLADQLSERTVDNLFRLGRYAALVEKGAIWAQLGIQPNHPHVSATLSTKR
jgi:predicted acylesterase/phospholipase RssA